MSGVSTSFTFPALPEAALKIVSDIKNNNLSGLDDLTRRNCLQTTSRNNWLEFHVRALVKKLNDDALSYLRVRFEPTGRPEAGSSAVVLRDRALKEAALGVRRLIESLRKSPEAYLASLDDIYTSEEIVEELNVEPGSLSEAIERFRVRSNVNEGDDFPTVAAFLFAHLSVLEHADKTTGAAIYAVWLY